MDVLVALINSNLSFCLAVHSPTSAVCSRSLAYVVLFPSLPRKGASLPCPSQWGKKKEILERSKRRLERARKERKDRVRRPDEKQDREEGGSESQT